MINSISSYNFTRPSQSFKADLEVSPSAKQFIEEDLADYRYAYLQPEDDNKIFGKGFNFAKYIKNLKAVFAEKTQGIPGIARIDYYPMTGKLPRLSYCPNGNAYSDYHTGAALKHKADRLDICDIVPENLIPPIEKTDEDLTHNPFVDGLIKKCAIIQCDCVGGGLSPDTNPFMKVLLQDRT